MSHFNMTDSQFKSFMAGVSRAAREEAGRLFNEAAHVARSQARVTAAAVARDEAKKVLSNGHATNGHAPTAKHIETRGWPIPTEGWKIIVADGTEFTYFRGQWRRRSELEGFASAAKYL